MNFLAHIYLSNDDPMHRIGNFMADHIKGSSYKEYPVTMQKGILLHRQIDSFTDKDEIVKTSKRRLHSRYGHYKGVIIDIVYDHFLAQNWNQYHHQPLEQFSKEFYAQLKEHWSYLPEKVQYLSRYMISGDWLTSYAQIDGIAGVLEGMNRRTGGKSHMDLAIEDLNNYKDEFEQDFSQFFEKLRIFCHEKRKEIDTLF